MDLKPSTTIDQQLALIEGKGFHIANLQVARDFLNRTGYYRLRAYFLPFKTHTGYEPVPFEQIMELYEFDNHLRGWLFKVIGEIESALKARLAAYLTNTYGTQCHTKASTFDSRHKHDEYRGRNLGVDATLCERRAVWC